MKYREYKFYCKQEELEELQARLSAAGIEEIIINDPADAELFTPDKAIGWYWNAVDESVLEQFRERPSVSFYLEAGDGAGSGTADSKAGAPADEAASDTFGGRAGRGNSGVAREYERDPEALKARDLALAELQKIYDSTVSIVDDQDWLHKWEEYYVPAKISDSFVVKPVWRDYEAKPGEHVIDIDPGLAFGTGTSATTYLVVRLMEKWMQPGDDVLDVGCGTGILSIVAERLGAREICAVDIDPEAIDSTRRNAELNGCSGRIQVLQGDLTKGLDFRADTVVANLISGLVEMLSPDVSAHCKGRGLYISSGIMDGTEDRVRKAIESAGFRIIDHMHDDCWHAYAAVLDR